MHPVLGRHAAESLSRTFSPSSESSWTVWTNVGWLTLCEILRLDGLSPYLV